MTAHDTQMRSSTYFNKVNKDMRAVNCPRAVRRVMTRALNNDNKENKDCAKAVTLKYFWQGQHEFSLEVDREQLAYAKLIKLVGEKNLQESGEFLYKVLSCEELQEQRKRNPHFKENFDIKLAL